jgi:hypothetical protein
VKHDIDRLVAGIAPAAGPGMTEGARELFEEILAGESSGAPAGRRRWRLALPLVAVLTGAAVAVGWLLPGGLGPRPASALDIRRESGNYVITVKRLFAAPERYEAELRARGIDISLTVEPVSPSLVGTIAPPFDKRYDGLSPGQIAQRRDLISSIERPGGCAGRLTCVIGLRVPVGYRGKARIMLGREGRPGERFHAFGQLNNPGEPLQCVALTDRTVADVRAMLSARNIRIGVFAVPLRGTRASVPTSWYVHEGWLTQPGAALLVAAPDRDRTPFPLDDRCPKRS